MKGITVMIAAGLAAGLSACGGAEDAPEAGPREPVAVAVAPVVAIDTTERLEAGGVVAALQSASLSSRIMATIVAVRVKAGDRVRAGDELVALDARDVAEHSTQARASAVAAENALAQARAERIAAEAEHRLATVWQKRIGNVKATTEPFVTLSCS